MTPKLKLLAQAEAQTKGVIQVHIERYERMAKTAHEQRDYADEGRLQDRVSALRLCLVELNFAPENQCPASALVEKQDGTDYIEVDMTMETRTPLDGFDHIYKHYAESFGRTPDAFMAKVVEETKARLLTWFSWNREAIRAALAQPSPPSLPQEVIEALKEARHHVSDYRREWAERNATLAKIDELLSKYGG